ncbi:aspartyl-tRNA synthetase [Eremomyces bilateralis CBS 781.70]|uniref:aspartate--tRNA ligase n=1 Tax=Eremomyces bilateralis CBS 781.70 TaxID=1392243 RepID=A0A6G1FW96_9PEZI|nr:aspartyl-tRNA synthetase [Eremomyces bilateralis CBS 781.70]KAF1810175.1 aspartyl-tRNA synthetase [Eremomyces bilateralis CBS 781.70]
MADEADKGPSKNALKKAAKEAEKAAKKAAKAATAQQQQAAEPEIPVEQLAEYFGELALAGPLNVPAPTTTLEKLPASGEVILRAAVYNARKQSAKLVFLNLRQGLSSIQAVLFANTPETKAMVKWAANIPVASIVLVHGEVKASPEKIASATIDDRELHITNIHVVSRAVERLPIQVEDAERPIPADDAPVQETKEGERPILSLPARLNNRVIDLKAIPNKAIFRIRHGIVSLFQEHLTSKGFVGIQTPKLIPTASEGGSNVFEVTYFDRKAYLAQSPQLYKQMVIASGFERVFEVGPVFRAENSNTSRHLTEFTGLDMEMEFDEDYHDVITTLENLMLFIFKGLNTTYKRETELLQGMYGVEPFKLPEEGQVPRLKYPEAIAMLREAGEELGDYDDLTTPQEKHLGRLVLAKYNTDFYVLDKFPTSVRPFYTMPDPENPKYSNSYDFFMRGQEILSGAQRIHDAPFLRKRMAAMDPPVPEKGAEAYIEAFEYGCSRHGGGGIGLERIVTFWLGLPNIRMATLFPRDPQRIAP